MDIVIIAQYLLDITTVESLNSRFVYVANMLKQKHSVEIITSDFIHGRKEHVSPIYEYYDIKITMLHEPGYKRNVSLKRFISHANLAKRVSKYLEKRKQPDVIYCAIPSIDVASAAAEHCRNNNIKYILDIQDLWPEAFKMIFDIPVISDLLFAPMKRKVDNIYRLTDAVVAVSQTYANRALSVNENIKEATVVFLGTERESFDRYVNEAALKNIEQNVNKHKKIIIGYIGSMERSYDIITVIDALSIISNSHIKLLAMGDGSKKGYFAEYARRKGIEAEFTGMLPHSQMVMRLSSCDIVVNPIRRGSAGSIINKVCDYAMAGVPVVNSQESEEYRELIDKYKMGLNCNNEDPIDMSEKIMQLINDEKLRLEMGRNARKCAEKKFDRKNTYKEIVTLIER